MVVKGKKWQEESQPAGKGGMQRRKKIDLQCDCLHLPILALAAFSLSSAPNLLQSKIYEFNLE